MLVGSGFVDEAVNDIVVSIVDGGGDVIVEIVGRGFWWWIHIGVGFSVGFSVVG